MSTNSKSAARARKKRALEDADFQCALEIWRVVQAKEDGASVLQTWRLFDALGARTSGADKPDPSAPFDSRSCHAAVASGEWDEVPALIMEGLRLREPNTAALFGEMAVAIDGQSDRSALAECWKQAIVSTLLPATEEQAMFLLDEFGLEGFGPIARATLAEAGRRFLVERERDAVAAAAKPGVVGGAQGLQTGRL